MISPQDWLRATTDSLVEVVDTYFEVDSMVEARFDDSGGAKCGAIIGLVSEQNSVQLMLMATRRGSEVLAKALLGFEQEERIETGDLADAIGEIVNIVAGMVKTVLNDQDDQLQLTLPTFVEGTLEPLGGQTATYELLRMGPVDTKVIVINGTRKRARQPRHNAA